MSAWIVTAAHIDVLVLAGVQFDVRFPLDPSTKERRAPAGPRELADTGAQLWQENHRSVNHRYRQDAAPPPYSPAVAEVLLDPVAVVKALDCYVYQSCEHPGWSTSAAADYCTRLRTAAMTGLPLTADSTTGSPYPLGWDEAPWGITDLAQAALSSHDGIGGDR